MSLTISSTTLVYLLEPVPGFLDLPSISASAITSPVVLSINFTHMTTEYLLDKQYDYQGAQEASREASKDMEEGSTYEGKIRKMQHALSVARELSVACTDDPMARILAEAAREFESTLSEFAEAPLGTS